MLLERKNKEIIDDSFFLCPFCICRFATKHDLVIHLQAYGTNKWEHVRQLDKAHRGVDRSFTGTVAKGTEKNKPNNRNNARFSF